MNYREYNRRSKNFQIDCFGRKINSRNGRMNESFSDADRWKMILGNRLDEEFAYENSTTISSGSERVKEQLYNAFCEAVNDEDFDIDNYVIVYQTNNDDDRYSLAHIWIDDPSNIRNADFNTRSAVCVEEFVDYDEYYNGNIVIDKEKFMEFVENSLKNNQYWDEY